MDEKQFKIINDKLDSMRRLLALNVVRDAKGDAQIKILASASFSPAETADMLGKGRNAVDQALHRIRQKDGSFMAEKSNRTKSAVNERAEGGEFSAKQ